MSWENIASSPSQTFSVFSNQDAKPRLMKFVIVGAVLIDSSHTISSVSNFLRSSTALGDLQVRVWRRCSSSWLQSGHLESRRSFLLAITLPVAVSPLSHFVINMSMF